MKVNFVLLALTLGLAGCQTPPETQHNESAQAIPMQSQPKVIVAPSGVMIHPYDQPEIIRKSIPTPP